MLCCIPVSSNSAEVGCSGTGGRLHVAIIWSWLFWKSDEGTQGLRFPFEINVQSYGGAMFIFAHCMFQHDAAWSRTSTVQPRSCLNHVCVSRSTRFWKRVAFPILNIVSCIGSVVRYKQPDGLFSEFSAEKKETWLSWQLPSDSGD